MHLKILLGTVTDIFASFCTRAIKYNSKNLNHATFLKHTHELICKRGKEKKKKRETQKEKNRNEAH